MRHTAIFALAPLVMMSTTVQAVDFTVADIQFKGLTRIPAESLYPMIDINAGELATPENIAQAIKNLYATGNFSNIKANRLDDTLIFDVVERPIIANVSFSGNKLIPKEALTEGLKRIGISEGNVLKQATLTQIQNELKQQYGQQGYYNSDIKVIKTELDNNNVALKFEFSEGKPARIVDINIVGNHYFSDEYIKDALNIKETSWKNIISKSDRYAKEKLNASLENLTAMYQNAGFVKFNINNAILNISPEKDKIYIEISVEEGEKYQFGEVSFWAIQPLRQINSKSRSHLGQKSNILNKKSPKHYKILTVCMVMKATILLKYALCHALMMREKSLI